VTVLAADPDVLIGREPCLLEGAVATAGRNRPVKLHHSPLYSRPEVTWTSLGLRYRESGQDESSD